MKKQVILFDLDGTLTDPAQGITNGVRQGLARFGIQETDQTALCRFIGPPLLDSFQQFYGLSPQEAQQATRIYRTYYGKTGMYENQVYPGVPELLSRLRAAGHFLAVATSKPEIFTFGILERFSLRQYFHQVGAATLDASRSQKTDVIRHTLHLCGDPDRNTVVMVGDRKYDILGAKENGLSSVGVLYGYGSREELEAAGADAIAATVSQLGSLLDR